tara:strand:+ start:536 stop:697 length:162 start_codon:yes stop_codon:yes gene_type:complete
MIDKIKNILGEVKESTLSACTTIKQLATGKAHMQDYMVVGVCFAAGVVLGSCL